MAILVVLVVILGIGYRVTTAEERARLLAAVLAHAKQATQAVGSEHPQCAAFRDALRGRTYRVFVTPALVALNAMVFVIMALGSGALDDPQTLIGWGGSFGPRTTNGEWWRLVTAMFVHSGLLAVMANVGGLLQVGVLLERLVGPFAFAGVYFAAGIFGGVIGLAGEPVRVTAGASAAIFGVYGLLLASSIRSMFPRSPVTMPMTMGKTLAPGAAVFLLYNLAAGDLPFAGEIAGLLIGVVSGAFVVRGVSEGKPPVRRVAVTMAMTVLFAAAMAIPLRGVVDVRPELQEIVAFEARTADAYRTVVARFREGRTDDRALIAVIEQEILPDLLEARANVKALGRVPPSHRWLVSGAEEYLRLREKSWRLRLEGLHRSKLQMLRDAEVAERAAWEALDEVRPARE